MNLLRKAASLLVEMPPEPPQSTTAPAIESEELSQIDADLPAEYRLPSDRGEHRPAKTVEQVVQEAPGPDLSQIHVDAHKVETAGIVSEQGLDFAAIYRAANVPGSTFTAEQMLEMLESLPSELPLDTKRATVKAMLSTLGKNMGATPESVVADSSRKLAALESFANFMQKKSSEVITQNETEIAQFQAQIEARREAIQQTKQELARVMQNCETESDKLDDVLEFFSLDVGASKYAPQESESDDSGGTLNAKHQ